MKSLSILKKVLEENVNKKVNLHEISKKLAVKLAQKYKKEKPDVTDEMIKFYIDGFERFKNGLPPEERDITKYTFDELEHLVDARTARRELKKGGKEKSSSEYDEEDINRIVYDKNNLKIIKGPTKDACIKYGTGQSTWCIARHGGSNLFYNYRYGNNLTIYFVLDEDKPRNDIDGGIVILVEPDGDIRLADRTNSGKYSGHQTISWSDALAKQPKLKGLEKLFQPNPLTTEEKADYNRIRSARVGDNPYESFNRNWEDVEKWLEYTSPTLKDIQYANLLSPLKKKYIALGFDLTPNMITNSDNDVIKYYKKKKVEKIKKTKLDNLTKEDIALLSHPSMEEIKYEIQPKLAQDLVKSTGNSSSDVEINYPDGGAAKYIALYGFNEVFDYLPKNLTKFVLTNRSDQDIELNVPSSIGQFKNLMSLQFTKCLKSLPEEIGELKNLNFLVLPENKNLTTLPASIVNLENIHFINLAGTPAELPQALLDRLEPAGGGFYWAND